MKEIMKKYEGNMKKYEGNMKKYEGNMKEQRENMKEIFPSPKAYIGGRGGYSS